MRLEGLGAAARIIGNVPQSARRLKASPRNRERPMDAWHDLFRRKFPIALHAKFPFRRKMQKEQARMARYGDGSKPISINFNGMNIHLPAVLWFTRYQGYDS